MVRQLVPIYQNVGVGSKAKEVQKQPELPKHLPQAKSLSNKKLQNIHYVVMRSLLLENKEFFILVVDTFKSNLNYPSIFRRQKIWIPFRTRKYIS